MRDEDLPLKAALVLVVALALVILGIDIYQVATGTVDMNRHWPFFVPACLGVIIWMCVYTLRHGKSEK